MGNTPNIRFKGFTDDWEQRKLGEFCNIVTGKLDANAMVEGGRYDFYTSGIQKYKIDTAAFEGPAITIAGNGATVGYMHLADGLFNAYQRTYVLSDFSADRQYLYSEIGRELPKKIAAEARTGNIPYIVMNMLTDLEISVPIAEEQQKIGKYFGQLDFLITLHQRKCDETKKLKKFMLQKMFPKKDEKKPEIRFADFTDDWEQRKLGDNIIEYTEKTTINNQYPVLTSSRKGIFFQTEYYDGNQVASADNTGYNIVPYGYFTYRHMSDDEIFHFNINDIAENGIVSTLYPVFTTDENLDSRYLQYQLNYGREFAKYAILQKQGGSRTYMYLNKLKNLYLIVPKSVNEQKRISGYFMQLDNLITLHRRAYYNEKGELTNVHNDN